MMGSRIAERRRATMDCPISAKRGDMTRSQKTNNGPFVLDRTDTVGAVGAEEDLEFLRACFVDTGDLSLLENPSENRLIVLGRTGAGKSALFERMKQTKPDRVIELQPENLALTYLGNSTTLNSFAAININLDPFFILLWRHIFTVEILNRYFQQYVAPQKTTFWDWLTGLFDGSEREEKEMQEAIAYLRSWGEEFWKETEYRVKEITQKMEVQLTDAIKAQLGSKYASMGVDMSTIQRLSAEEKIEVQHRGQEIVSGTQVKDLNVVLKLLANILRDKQKQYFIIVDRLDENWVEEKLRYRLIMALIQTAKEFIRVNNAKIIIALRRDLIERVFRLAREAGFQEEKFQSLYLPLIWTKEQILEVLDQRVQYMVRRRYTKGTVGFRDLLPAKFNGLAISDYIFDLASRPRDVIQFFNACIQAGAGYSKLTVKQLAFAESEYSKGRLRALADEWSADHPSLLDFAGALTGHPSSFKLECISARDVEDLCLNIIAEHPEGRGVLHEGAKSVVDGIHDPDAFKITMFQVFYRVGLVGIKTNPHEPASWMDGLTSPIVRSLIDNTTSIVVAPRYIRALGVRDEVHRIT